MNNLIKSLLFSLLVIFLGACDEGRSLESTIIGVWRADQVVNNFDEFEFPEITSHVWHINSDGTYTYESPNWTATGTWNISGQPGLHIAFSNFRNPLSVSDSLTYYDFYDCAEFSTCSDTRLKIIFRQGCFQRFSRSSPLIIYTKDQ